MWRVDTSGAPRDHPDLAGTIQDVQDRLNDPGFVKALCVHESAHAVYWGFIGQETVPDYVIRLARDGIEYAAVNLVDPEQPKGWTAIDLAKAHAAGSVAAGVIAPGYEVGDLKDRDNFKADILFAKPDAPISDIEMVWNMACDALRTELQDPDSAIRLDIKARAIDFERNFRLVSEIRET